MKELKIGDKVRVPYAKMHERRDAPPWDSSYVNSESYIMTDNISKNELSERRFCLMGTVIEAPRGFSKVLIEWGDGYKNFKTSSSTYVNGKRRYGWWVLKEDTLPMIIRNF